MITTATLKAFVGGYLKIDSTDYDRFQIEESLNAAQRHLLSILPAHIISEAVKNVKGDLDQDVRFYQWPSDFIRALRLWLNYDDEIADAAPGQPAKHVDDPSSVESYWSQATTLYPLYGTHVEGGFEIMPVPTADQANGFRLQYVQLFPAISDVQDSMMPAHLTNLMVYYATMLSAGVEGAFPEIISQMRDLYREELEIFLPKKEDLNNGRL